MSSDGSSTDPSSKSHQGTGNPSRALAASDANIRNFAPVARIMKMALPDNAKIAKEAKECMQECVSEFISFITSEGMFDQSFWEHPSVLTSHSIREVSTGEAKDCQWRGHSLRHDVAGFRELRRGAEDISVQVPRGEFCLTLRASLLSKYLTEIINLNIELIGMRPNLQGARTRPDQQAAGGMRPVALAPTMPLQPAPLATLPANPRMPTAY